MKKTKIAVSLLTMLVLLFVSLLPLSAVFATEGNKDEVKYTVTVPFDVTEEDEEDETNKLEKPEYEDLASRFLTVQPIMIKSMPEVVVENLKVHFSKVYATLAEVWNHGVMFDIVYTVGSTDVAYQTSGSNNLERKIVMNAEHMIKNRANPGALTHELTHAMQAYKDAKYSMKPATSEGGNWIKEGLADYSRFMYDLKAFSLDAYADSQSYTSSYRKTARFFGWLNQNFDTTFLDQFNEALRSEAYTSKIFVKITGKTVDELWQIYAASDHKVTK